MDFIEIISGQFILEFLGASVRFLYFNLSTLLNNDDFRTFSSFWSPNASKKKKKENDQLNNLVGVIFFCALIFAFIIFNV